MSRRRSKRVDTPTLRQAWAKAHKVWVEETNPESETFESIDDAVLRITGKTFKQLVKHSQCNTSEAGALYYVTRDGRFIIRAARRGSSEIRGTAHVPR
jgi:hypothetical protein